MSIQTLSEPSVTFFGEVDTLNFFSDRFSLMSIEQQIALARTMNQHCKGYERILVIETGASPMVMVMQELEKREIFYLKIPREISPQNLASLDISYPTLRAFTSEPFLILDEYVDSGHTMKLVLNYLKHLGCKEHYKIICYMLFSQDPAIQKLLHFACANNPSKEKIFQDDFFARGIYPFENRLDYAPYFYHEGKKVALDVFIIPTPKHVSESPLEEIAEEFLSQVCQAITVPCVAEFISPQHICLYSLFCKETDPMRKQFFWLLFDMIGPFWTPLPQAYHFAYWKGFESIQAQLTAQLNNIELNLPTLAHQAATIMLKNHHQWFKQIKETIRSPDVQK